MKTNEEKINEILLKRGFEILSERAWKRLAFSWLAFVPFTLNAPVLFFIEAIFSKNILPQKQFLVFINLSIDYNKSSVIFTLKDYLKLTETEIVACFSKNKLGTNMQAKMFFKLMRRVDREFFYNNLTFNKKVKQIDYKELIEEIKRYLKIDEDGTAEMIVSVLVRYYGVNYNGYDDKNTIALPSAIKTIFRLGLIKQETPKALQAKTRKLFPLFPEIYDYAIGEIASNFCYRINEPNCEQCYMNKVCPKIF